jgi:3-oxoacyl-(acyl-carrier-protein) synthase/NADPH:quinone reductase-like Zn-dependent oxidoreductase/acyl carrier protein
MTPPADMPPPPLDQRAVLQRALVEIRALKARLAEAEAQLAGAGARGKAAPIAIIGIGCRFGGGIDGPEAFWHALMARRDAIGPRPAGRWDGAETPGAFLEDVEGFDAGFFGIAPKEAAAADPQHRLFLEVAWEALEHGGIAPHSLGGSETGVFLGLATNDYAARVAPDRYDRLYGSGSSPAIAAGRLSYLLDLRGPAVTLDTACSSSLVAVHAAMQSLRSGASDLALAGGVSLMLGPALWRSFAAAGMLAADGHSKSFDARADGYGRGEGCGVVVLRRLDDALKAGDPVLAVLRGGAVGQDGRSAGLTAPNGPAQSAVIRRALADAGVTPDSIDYIEAHGTGTPLGDPIEAHALSAVFAGRAGPLRIGSVKSSLGHTEAAAGVAALIKAVLMLVHDTVPPQLHFTALNPAIGKTAVAFSVPTAAERGVARVGVSAFGFSGTNAHLVVEAAPPAAETATRRASLPRTVFRRDHFPLPPPIWAEPVRADAPSWQRVLEPNDPLLAGCAGIAHLGILLALLEQAGLPPMLGRITFLAPLRVTVGRLLRLRADDERFVLESAEGPHSEWTEHLSVSTTPAGTQQPVPPMAALPLHPASGLYRKIEDYGFAFGPEARCLARIGADEGSVEALLAEGGANGLGPGAVEGAAQLVYALLAPGAPAVMLASAQRISRGTGGAPHRAWLRRRQGPPAATIHASFGLCDADGTDLLLVEEAAFVPLPDHSARWSRSVQWQAVSIPSETGAAVMLDGAPTERRVAEALGRLAAQPGTALVWIVRRGTDAALCADALSLIAALSTQSSPLRIVTHGAQLTGAEAAPVDLDQAALWGLAQALMGEQPARRCRLIDLDPGLSVEAQVATIAIEAAADDGSVVAWRGGRRLARVMRPLPSPPQGLRRAGMAAPGRIVWSEIDDASGTVVPAGMAVVEVVAAGLTFRDRLLMADQAPAGSRLGSDCAGIVRGLGQGVEHLKLGQPVVVLVDGAMADRVLVEAWRVAPAPAADLVDAATMPVPYLTALAGLGAIAAWDVVLVHQAGSATGLAALAVARRAGARVILTAGRGRHAWFAEEPDCGALLDSRDPASWGDAVATVTVAIGAFEDDAVAVLAHARIVNLSRRAAGHFNLETVPPAEVQALLGRLAAFPPLPKVVAPRDALVAMLERSSATQVGRSVVLMRPPPPVSVAAGALYLVTGAVGSLGRLVAGWLMAAGGLVCLLDRTPVDAVAPHRAVTADVADEAAMAGLFDRLMAEPVRLAGVFHCAALTDDAPLSELTADRVAAVLQAKATGARILDRLTRTHCRGARRLDHFVLFSSLVSVMPSARQGAYAAANAVLDQLARARQQHGHPALSLNFGPWEAGIGQRMGTRAAAVWSRHGVTPILPAMGLRALPALLASAEPQRLVADMVWEKTDVAPKTIATVERLGVAQLQATLAEILGMARPEEIDADTLVAGYGLDSLGSVEFSRAVSLKLGRPVSVDFTYNYPTLRQMEAALDKREPARLRAAGSVLLAPVWSPLPALAAARRDPGRWRVSGQGVVAEALRATIGDGAADRVLDVSALGWGPISDLGQLRAARDGWFQSILAMFASGGPPARALVIAMPSSLPLAGAMEGFLAALGAERPDCLLRSLRLDPGMPDPAQSIMRELGQPGAERCLRLSATERRVRRLEALTGTAETWTPDPEASYLVTGGSGGIGALVAAHLVARGARHLILASRRPSLPAPLAGSVARITLTAADMGDAASVSALLHLARDQGPRLAGVFHIAGVTANGRVGEADWTKIGRAFAPKADGAYLLHSMTQADPLDRFVMFSSSTAWFGLAGTAGYAAANGYLDDLAVARRAAGLPGQSIAWGAWEGVGMAADAAVWADGRVPSLAPGDALAALDQALAQDAATILVVGRDWHARGHAQGSPLAVSIGE